MSYNAGQKRPRCGNCTDIQTDDCKDTPKYDGSGSSCLNMSSTNTGKYIPLPRALYIPYASLGQHWTTTFTYSTDLCNALSSLLNFPCYRRESLSNCVIKKHCFSVTGTWQGMSAYKYMYTYITMYMHHACTHAVVVLMQKMGHHIYGISFIYLYRKWLWAHLQKMKYVNLSGRF